MKYKRLLPAVVLAAAMACAAPAVWAADSADTVPTLQQLQSQIAQNRQAVLAKIAVPVSDKVFYFDAAGQLRDTPQAGGFYRKVLGKTADGQWVVEDFFQDSQTTQTDPAILSDRDLRNFIDPKLDGWHAGYYSDGRVATVMNFHHGEAGESLLYDESGVLRLRLYGESRFVYFDRNGRKRADIHIDGKNKDWRIWYENGRLAVVKKDQDHTYRVWRNDGTEVADEKYKELIFAQQTVDVFAGMHLVMQNQPGSAALSETESALPSKNP